MIFDEEVETFDLFHDQAWYDEIIMNQVQFCGVFNEEENLDFEVSDGENLPALSKKVTNIDADLAPILEGWNWVWLALFMFLIFGPAAFAEPLPDNHGKLPLSFEIDTKSTPLAAPIQLDMGAVPKGLALTSMNGHTSH